jgi:hypothetical protein
MKTRISKAYRGSEHVGWKKTVAGREWFLCYGTSPSDEARATAVATALQAQWQLIKLSGGTHLSETDFEDAKALALGQPSHSPQPLKFALPVPVAEPAPVLPVVVAPAGHAPRRWLHASVDEFISYTMKSLDPAISNGDHIINTRDRIARAREAKPDIPLDMLERKELDEWLLEIKQLKSKFDGKPLGPATVRNLTGAVRLALTKFVEWKWWTPPLWENAFNGYTIKKLETPAQRKRRRKRPATHNVYEKRVLWHLALDFLKAMMALADWAGHTQKECATITFDEILEVKGEMFIERDRNKTGVSGRWWIPPEAADVIRRVVARTPRDPQVNPNGLAFLTPKNQPLVHRSKSGRHTRSDYVGKEWESVLRAAKHYGVRPISYKFMRKGSSQFIRDKYNKEVSRAFLAQADEDVQDEAYTRTCLSKVERATRRLYKHMKKLFEPINAAEWPAISAEIERHNQNGADTSTMAA